MPVGILVGRWLWRVVADELGVATPPETPVLWIPVLVVAVLAAALAVALVPGWAAARTSTAEALRSE